MIKREKMFMVFLVLSWSVINLMVGCSLEHLSDLQASEEKNLDVVPKDGIAKGSSQETC